MKTGRHLMLYRSYKVIFDEFIVDLTFFFYFVKGIQYFTSVIDRHSKWPMTEEAGVVGGTLGGVGCRLTGWWQKFCLMWPLLSCSPVWIRKSSKTCVVLKIKNTKNSQTLSDCVPSRNFSLAGKADLIWPPRRAESSPPGSPVYHHGKSGNGRPHSPHQQTPRRLQLHRPELQLGSAANSGGRRPERREELRAGEFRREVVSCLWILVPESDFELDYFSYCFF